MELSTSEQKHAIAITQDLDLMNMARDYTGLTDTSVPPLTVLESLHAHYPGGVSQFYNEKSF